MVRVGVEALVEAYERVCREGMWGRPVFFMAPTGYGKTSSTLLLYKASMNACGPPRMIHVLPLRAVVEQVYARISSSASEFTVGYQAHSTSLPGKAPFMASDVVVSTMDSFMINLFRGNVAEGGGGQGHYEVPRSFILTSTVVFDEAHMPMQATGGHAEALHTAVAVMGRVLVEFNCPFIIESATIPPSVLRSYIDLISRSTSYKPLVIEPLPSKQGLTTPLSSWSDIEYCIVEDQEFYENAASVEWVYGETSNPVEEAIRLVECGSSVFRAVNTVEEAVKEYVRIRSELGDENTALIHGRMTPKDRRRSIEKLERIQNKGVLVGTQAVEAGVDADFKALITDPSCPESLVQRMGRVNRKLREREALILIAKKDPEYNSLVKKLERLNPRLPYDYSGFRGYTSLFGEDRVLRINIRRYDELVKLASTPILSPVEVEKIHYKLCDIVRGRILVPVAPHPLDLSFHSGFKVESTIDDEISELLLENSFPVDQEMLYEKAYAGEWLERVGDKVLALALEWRGDDNSRRHPCEISYRVITVEIDYLSSCSRLRKLFSRKHVVLFILAKGAYKPGVGLC